MNKGKDFEQDFKKSLEFYKDIWIYRPSDFGGGQATRFTNHSLCDYIMFDYTNGELYFFECKSTQSSSFSCPSHKQFLELLERQKEVDECLTKEDKKAAQKALKELTKKMNAHDIKYHQIKSLYETSQVAPDKMKCYFVLNFRDYDNKTFFIKPKDLINSLIKTKKSSINMIDVLESDGIEIPQSQIRNTKHFFYDVSVLRGE